MRYSIDMDAQLEKQYRSQGAMLANRVKKRYNHLRKRYARQHIDVFRLYDWDIPEIRAVVDWYGGHLVVGEYTRRQSTPEWLPMMGEAVARALAVPSDNLHLKARFYGRRDGNRYQRIDHTDKLIALNERDLKFFVNPYDFVDTGLFSDHRNTRALIRQEAKGKDFLNLFCYSGAFTCAAVQGGASASISVDRSRTAIQWTRKNMTLNGLDSNAHQYVQAHVPDFLTRARQRGERFDLAVVDPPSFYTIRTRDIHFDIVQGHPALINRVIDLMRDDGVIYFSTNHQDFVARMELLKRGSAEEITDRTIPEDYVRKRHPIHRCWRITF